MVVLEVVVLVVLEAVALVVIAAEFHRLVEDFGHLVADVFLDFHLAVDARSLSVTPLADVSKRHYQQKRSQKNPLAHSVHIFIFSRTMMMFAYLNLIEP